MDKDSPKINSFRKMTQPLTKSPNACISSLATLLHKFPSDGHSIVSDRQKTDKSLLLIVFSPMTSLEKRSFRIEREK